MTVLVVTGTRHGRPDVAYWLDRWVAKFGLPTKLVIGDSDDWVPERGVDWQAWRWSHRWTDLVVVRETCCTPLKSPWRFHERDQRMANHVGPGDWCLGFPIASSRGTHLTMNMCRKRGARVVECPLRSP